MKLLFFVWKMETLWKQTNQCHWDFLCRDLRKNECSCLRHKPLETERFTVESWTIKRLNVPQNMGLHNLCGINETDLSQSHRNTQFVQTPTVPSSVANGVLQPSDGFQRWELCVRDELAGPSSHPDPHLAYVYALSWGHDSQLEETYPR